MIDIIVDAIDNSTFHFVNKYVTECLQPKPEVKMEVEQ